MISNKKIYISGIVLLFITLFLGGMSYFSSSKISKESPTKIVHLKNGETYTLTATKITKILKGKEQNMLAYNGSIPGPQIVVEQGSLISIVFKNNTDSPQLLHSHGVRLDNLYDGSQMIQKEVMPGESFTYKIKFPDAGVYWYHPHAGEVVGQALGLYGAFIVTPISKEYFPPVNKEETLFLNDLPVLNGTISIKENDHSLMGHYGNLMLVNGKESYSLSVNQGDVVRFNLINAANARPFNFSIPNATLKVVGGDSGGYEKAFFVNSVVLAPSERSIVDVYFKEKGTYTIINKTPEITYTLGTVQVLDTPSKISYKEPFVNLKENREVIESIDPFRSFFYKHTDKKITLSLSMEGGMGMTGMHQMPDGTMMGGMVMNTPSKDGIEWNDSGMMGAIATKDSVSWKIVDTLTGKENMDIMWDFVKDKPVVIEIHNDKNIMHPMQHPIHFHGQRFLVVSRNGVPQTNLVWKDTTLVRIGETVKILLVPSNPGEWMAHCHISEHLVSGMMLGFMVR